MDETPLFYDIVSSKTVQKKSIKVRTTGSKRITAGLSNTSTEKMLPPKIIFKGKQRVVFVALEAPMVQCSVIPEEGMG